MVDKRFNVRVIALVGLLSLGVIVTKQVRDWYNSFLEFPVQLEPASANSIIEWTYQGNSIIWRIVGQEAIADRRQGRWALTANQKLVQLSSLSWKAEYTLTGNPIVPAIAQSETGGACAVLNQQGNWDTYSLKPNEKLVTATIVDNSTMMLLSTGDIVAVSNNEIKRVIAVPPELVRTAKMGGRLLCLKADDGFRIIDLKTLRSQRFDGSTEAVRVFYDGAANSFCFLTWNYSAGYISSAESPVPNKTDFDYTDLHSRVAPFWGCKVGIFHGEYNKIVLLKW